MWEYKILSMLTTNEAYEYIIFHRRSNLQTVTHDSRTDLYLGELRIW